MLWNVAAVGTGPVLVQDLRRARAVLPDYPADTDFLVCTFLVVGAALSFESG